VLFDWIAREGWIVLNWWLLITAAGAAIFPLCVRLLSGLPDKGYTFARAAGLLMTAFVFWLLASLGLLRNNPGSIVLSWFIVLVVSLMVYARIGESFDWRAWWHENRRVVLTAEIVFAVLLFSWAVVRAHQNGIYGTEKPMDLAFMSAAQRSAVYPPDDPWLSGYAISYYYFGYVISAMLSTMSGVASTIGFNMNITMLFALTGLTAFGVVYNLVRSRALRQQVDSTQDDLESPKRQSQTPALLAALLGTVFMVLMGNFQTVFVEIPYQARAVSEGYLRFWDTKDRDSYQGQLEPRDIINDSGWWWFSASRTLTDRDFDDVRRNEVIDEFPQFSFLLADNHPHVMSLPYAVLAIGLSLNLLLTWRSPTRHEILFYGLCIGALVFLNTWDCPIYIFVMVGTDTLRRIMRNGSGRLLPSDWLDLFKLTFALVVITVIAYFPFLVGFRSQLSGVLPNLLYPTRLQQYFLMFGPFILILAAFLVVEAWRGSERSRMNWLLGVQVSGIVLAVLLLSMLLLSVIGYLFSPDIRSVALGFVDAYGGWGAVLPTLLGRWLTYGVLMAIFILSGVSVVVARLFPRMPDEWDAEAGNREVVTYPVGTGFALLLIGAGLMLTYIPNFLYLRDNFGDRMNTIFKFFYQAWVVFSIASAYAIYTMFADSRLRLPRQNMRYALGLLFAVGIGIGLVYPVLGIRGRMFVETGRLFTLVPPTLDGGRTLISGDDYDAIMCLKSLVQGQDVIVAEAVGPAYHGEYGRVGALTGIPIVMGWENHERQWRGTSYNELAGTRAQDIIELYTDLRWDVVQPIIEKYGIDYIFYGSTERFGQYTDSIVYTPAGEQKFEENLEIVCERGGSRFYKVASQQTARTE
jgi:YYY domain-containing protein